VLRHETKTVTQSRPRPRPRTRRGATLVAIAATATIALVPAVAPAADGHNDGGYARLFEQAKELGVAPKTDLSGTAAGRAVLEDGVHSLRKEIGKARRHAKPEYGTPGSVGVDQSTLDAVAACESGGDPTAVDASGTYRGKYQFDLGTWASVGGSGDPAAAPEAEQDYRAALLMSRAGSSPWPVCG
jgi:soluble lytic murein transglycosylase-like protein